MSLYNADLIPIGINDPNLLRSYVLVNSRSIFYRSLCASRYSYAATSPNVETIVIFAVISDRWR
jgi:hypothetical protein